jgi:hypothetical protein
MKIIKINLIAAAIIILFAGSTYSQLVNTELKLKSNDQADMNLEKMNLVSGSNNDNIIQKPTKKIYFVPGGKIGMLFLQGDYTGNQMISLEAFGKFVGDGFFAEISLPFRFKTSPAFTDIGLDLNVMYPFLGPKNKSEIEPYVGGGLGLHFIGRDANDAGGSRHIAARGGLGLNVIAGTTFFKNYDFNIMVELKYFYYLREFDNLKYQGIGLNVGATIPR